MSLDAHPDREPPMEARVFDSDGAEFVKTGDGSGLWFLVGSYSLGFTWAELATTFPDGRVDLP